jgi:hypothetical protein
MPSRSPSSLLLMYFGGVAAALSVTALGLAAIVQASGTLSHASVREKTTLELQVESSRAIRRALATPMVVAPLPPITARPARDLREAAAAPATTKPAHPKLSREARSAMAMAQSGAPEPPRYDYPTPDRHTQY